MILYILIGIVSYFIIGIAIGVVYYIREDSPDDLIIIALTMAWPIAVVVVAPIYVCPLIVKLISHKIMEEEK